MKNSGGQPRNLAWGHAIVVVQGSGAAAAAKFAAALTSGPEDHRQWFARRPACPRDDDRGLDSAKVRNDTFTANFATAIGAHSEPDPFWIYPQFAQIQQVLATQVQAALIGKASPQDALAEAKQQMEALAK